MSEVVNIKTKKKELTELIEELTNRMVGALDASQRPPEEGKETASFADIKACLSTVCDVYRLLNSTGDLDESGTALTDYEKRMGHGRANQNR